MLWSLPPDPDPEPRRVGKLTECESVTPMGIERFYVRENYRDSPASGGERVQVLELATRCPSVWGYLSRLVAACDPLDRPVRACGSFTVELARRYFGDVVPMPPPAFTEFTDRWFR